MMSNLDRTPVAYHQYLTTNSGERLPVYRLLHEFCPVCGPHNQGGLGVTWEDPRAETVQCLVCDFSETRPIKLPPGRRMNGSDGRTKP